MKFYANILPRKKGVVLKRNTSTIVFKLVYLNIDIWTRLLL